MSGHCPCFHTDWVAHASLAPKRTPSSVLLAAATSASTEKRLIIHSISGHNGTRQLQTRQYKKQTVASGLISLKEASTIKLARTLSIGRPLPLSGGSKERDGQRARDSESIIGNSSLRNKEPSGVSPSWALFTFTQFIMCLDKVKSLECQNNFTDLLTACLMIWVCLGVRVS